MGTANFTDEFKRDAVAQITERGYPIKEVSERLAVSLHSLHAWKRKFGNPKRKHARNGMLSPVKFERRQKMRHEGVQETLGYSDM